LYRTAILFDIDGTLIHSGGAGKAALQRALASAFALTEIHDSVDFRGRTDGAIIRDLLTMHAIAATPESQACLVASYLDHLPVTLRSRPGRVLPGVRALLDHLRGRGGTLLGLLTGNIRAGAKIKLGHFDLFDYFRCGGFGDGVVERDEVARAALAEVRAHAQALPAEQIWVIGDTPLDVRCARAIGARAVAVGTGWHSLAELAESNPDLLLEDLSSPAPLFAAIG
jgi:phosphoglycolate phosphatase